MPGGGFWTSYLSTDEDKEKRRWVPNLPKIGSDIGNDVVPSQRLLQAPHMSRSGIALTEFLTKAVCSSSGNEASETKLPVLQAVVPGSAADDANGVESGRTSHSRATAFLGELGRRKKKHPRLRWPRLACADCSQTSEIGIISDASPRSDSLSIFDASKEFDIVEDKRQKRPAKDKSETKSRVRDDGHPALLPRATPRQNIAVGAATTVHLPRDDNKRIDAASSPKLDKAAKKRQKDRKYLLRQAPVSVLIGDEHFGGGQTNSHTPRSGQVKPPMSEYLNFEGWGLDDRYIEDLISHTAFAKLRHINMAENRLTDQSLNVLMHSDEVQWDLHSLQLSHNRLRERGGFAVASLIHLKRPPLRQLDLEGNLIGDAACEHLCGALREKCCVSLLGLGLACNEIGHSVGVGSAIGNLLSMSKELTTVDLHWNVLHGSNASAILQGVYENDIGLRGNLRRLDLSWNRLGVRCVSAKAVVDESAASEARTAVSAEKCGCNTCSACAQVAHLLARIFREGTMLFHLDLSQNGVAASECAILAEGLRRNHTLFGIHMVGNEAMVDPYGFIIPYSSSSAVQHELRQQRANRYYENIPNKMRLEGVGEASEKNRLERFGIRPSTGTGKSSSAVANVNATIGLIGGTRANPSLKKLANTGTEWKAEANLPFSGVFSEEDLKQEKEWADLRSRVQQPLDFGASGFEVNCHAPCCWICENWIEHRVSYIPGWSGPENSVDDVTSVYAFFSIEDFSRGLQLFRTEETYSARLLEVERDGNGISRATGPGQSYLRSEPCLTTNGKMIRWIGVRRLPPTMVPIQVIFQVNNTFCVADDQMRKSLPTPKTVKLLELSVSDGNPPAANSSTAEGWHEASSPIDIHEANVVRPWTNTWEQLGTGHMDLHVLALEDPKKRAAALAKPRKLNDETVATERPRWRFEDSVWSGYKCEPPDCFDNDWNLCRVSKFVKDPYQHEHLRKVLREAYPCMVMAFHYYAFRSFQQGQGPVGLSLLVFTELLGRYGGGLPSDNVGVRKTTKDFSRMSSAPVKMPEQPDARQHDGEVADNSGNAVGIEADVGESAPTERGAHTRFASDELDEAAIDDTPNDQNPEALEGDCAGEAVDSTTTSAYAPFRLFNKNCILSDADTIFVGSTVVENRKQRQKEFRGLPEKGLGRFQFLEAIVRIAVKRFSSDSGVTMSASAATEELLKRMNIGHDIRTLRKELYEELFCEECDMVYREFQSALEGTYMVYRKVGSYPGRPGWGLTLVGWAQLAQDMEVQTLGISMKNVYTAFVFGREVRVEEVSSMRHMELSYLEFLVAIGALTWLRSRLADDDDLGGGMGDQLCDLFTDRLAKAYHSRRGINMDTASHGTGDPAVDAVLAFAASIFKQYDNDQSGEMDILEFKMALNQGHVQKELRDLGVQLEDVNMIFEQIDSDGTGSITLAELSDAFIKLKLAMRGVDRAIAYLRKAFAEADEDDSGSLNPKEVHNMLAAPRVQKRLEALGVPCGEVDALLEQFDADPDMEVSANKLIQAFLEIRDKGIGQSRGATYLWQLFKEADTKGDGELTREVMQKHFVGNYDLTNKLRVLKLEVPDWLSLFDNLDLDGSGTISWEELSQGMAQYWQKSREKVVLASMRTSDISKNVNHYAGDYKPE